MGTLLLCFIHGFSGDDDTFHSFPSHLRDHVQKSLPELKVVSAVYPKYETKGDLPSCVTKFREWHQARVNALEIEAEADSKTTPDGDASGFVAADAVISVVDEQAKAEAEQKEAKLPWIQGILAVDTPFLGIASPMLAYSAFSQFSKVSNAYRLMSMLPLSFLRTKNTNSSKPGPVINKRTPWELGAIPAWRTVAAYTGTTGALAAAGVAAYMNREEIYQGYTWIQNHLQFVGVILKREQSRLKLARVTALEDFGFANLYTSLGNNSVLPGASLVPERTFCALPPPQNPLSNAYRKEINLVAKDEIDAHTCMFQEERNPGYNRLLDDARELITEWAPRPYHRYRTKNLEEKTKEAMDERINDAFKDMPAGDGEGDEASQEGALDDGAFILPAEDGNKDDGGKDISGKETGEAANADSQGGSVNLTNDDMPPQDNTKQTGKAENASPETQPSMLSKATSSLKVAANRLGNFSVPTLRKEPPKPQDSLADQATPHEKDAATETRTA